MDSPKQQKGGSCPPPFCTGVVRGLKAESGLEFNHPGAESTSRFAEVRTLDIALDAVPAAGTIQVDFIEQVVEVGANFDLSILANQFHVRQPERLAELGIDIKVARPGKRVAGNAWR